VTRSFDHDLHVVLPGERCQLPQRAQLGELRFVVGVGDAARTQPVAERERDVVGLHDLAHLFEVRVQKTFFMMRKAPSRHDRPAARDDAGQASRRQRHEAQAHAGVHVK
jgi:hypothetical protein